jgi:hypothetical protein
LAQAQMQEISFLVQHQAVVPLLQLLVVSPAQYQP